MLRFALPDPDTLSPLRGLHSLTAAHAAALTAALPGTWSVASHEGYDGDLTLLLQPSAPAAATLVLSKAAAGFQLHASHGDALDRLGTFASLAAVLAAVRTLADTAGALPSASPERAA